MKKNSLLTSTALIAVVALTTATTSIAANLLTNPGFETDAVSDAAPVAGATGWTAFNGANTVSANGYVKRTGIGSLQLPGNGNFGVPGAYQTFTAVPGQLWDFQGYLLTSNTLPATITFGLLKIVWSDGATDLQPAGATIGNAVTGANPGIESTPLLNSSSTPNVWQFTRAQGVAPAGTTQVKLYALMVDQSAGTAYFDDLQATNSLVVPLAASITSPANLAQVGANFTINAAASVLPGAVTNVYFYDGAALLGNDDTAPYTFGVTGAADGSHALKVVAKGTNGVGGFISVTSSVVNVTVVSAVTVYVDPSKAWLGFMNVFALGAPGYGIENAGGFVFGSGWATNDLCAIFSGSVLTLSPNKINDPDPFWYNSTGIGSVGNKIMDASMYVEPSPSLPGLTVIFKGTCLANTLAIGPAGPVNPAGNGWTCVAFIKDFAPDFSSSVSATTTLTNGMPFSIALATINDPARHVQYGFETIGPDVWPTDTALPLYGNVQVGPANAVSITPSLSGATLNLSFPTQTGFSYTVQYKTNLTDATWNTLTTTNGTGSTAVPKTSANNASRFYRLSIQ